MYIFVTKLRVCKCQKVEPHAETAVLAALAWGCARTTAGMLLFVTGVGVSAGGAVGTIQRSAALCHVHIYSENFPAAQGLNRNLVSEKCLEDGAVFSITAIHNNCISLIHFHLKSKIFRDLKLP